MILALDGATKTGWCLLKDGKVYESGVQDFSKTRGESNGALFLKFRHWLSLMLDQHDIKFVVYESAHHRGGAATEIGVNLTGRVQEICAECGIEYASVHTGTLKKFATGSGAASKETMVVMATVILGRKPIDDNEADAVHLALWAFHEYGVR
jgi:Holliday junction resolvasome RuvABC endonuclease subunit